MTLLGMNCIRGLVSFVEMCSRSRAESEEHTTSCTRLDHCNRYQVPCHCHTAGSWRWHSRNNANLPKRLQLLKSVLGAGLGPRRLWSNRHCTGNFSSKGNNSSTCKRLVAFRKLSMIPMHQAFLNGKSRLANVRCA